MADAEQSNSSRLRRVLAFLPLLAMGGGLWYFINSRALRTPEEPAAPPASGIFKAPEEPAAPGPAAGTGAAAGLSETYDSRSGVDIQGSPEFVNQATRALKLIWLSDRETFFFLKRNLFIIRNEDKTGFYLDGGRPVAALSRDHAFRSLTWCAGVIAHQGWHAWYTLTKNKKSRPAPPPPGEKDEREFRVNHANFDYKGLDAIFYIEDKASAFQLAVLRKVGAPARETGPVLRRAPREFQYAHDGNYALNP